MTTVDYFPLDDLIGHEYSDDCVCGPEVQPIETDDGSMAWLVVHHSLDGREVDGVGR